MQPCLPVPISRDYCPTTTGPTTHTRTSSRSVADLRVLKRSEVKLATDYYAEKSELVLSEKALSIEQPKSNRLIIFNLEDVLGLKVPDGSVDSAKLITCSATSTERGKKTNREIRQIPVYFCEVEGSRQLALEWKQEIQLQCLKSNPNLLGSPEQRPRTLLVIINPVSGSSKGFEQYRDLVRPMFDVAGVTVVREIITERRNHAKEAMSSFDLTQISGIVVVGGDGTVYEVINGLMSRGDWETSIKTPIGVIPTGSGNGLIASILHELGEECSFINAAFQVIRGRTRPVDLASVYTSREMMVHMFLSVTWGLIADIDIESEVLRFLGELRLVLGTLKNIIQKRIYTGRISYLPNDLPSLQSVLEMGRHEATSTCTSSNGPSTELLTPLSEPVPSDWVTIEDSFVGVIIAMVPCLTNTYVCHPSVSVGSGDFFIILMKEDLSRGEMVSALASQDYNKLQVIRTRAWRIEPLTTPGHLVVDGELVDYGPIQAQSHKHLLNVFSCTSN